MEDRPPRLSTPRFVRHPLVRRVRELASKTSAADGVVLGLGAVVGLVTGLFAVALIELIAVVQRFAFGSSPGPLTIVTATTLGGLAVGMVTTYVAPEAAGGGPTRVMESIAVSGGRMRARVAPVKLVTSALSLGTAASGGREGPMVQIGGAVGSLLGRMLALDEEQKRALIAGGAAAGIAAAFNAPIGGMLFAIEVILGGFRLRYLQVIVIAAVVGSVTARQIVGEALIYSPPAYTLGAPSELAIYAVIGALAVPVGLALGHGEHLAARFFAGLRVWAPLRTAIGGLAIGMIALLLPEAVGTGDHLPPITDVREPIATMLAGDLAPRMVGTGFVAAGFLSLLIVVKLVATSISIGSGASVGSFGPSIFLGAALGGAVGHLTAAVAPGIGTQSGAFALVGMAAVLAAGARAPLTGILIAFELTGGYGLVLPLMLACGIAMVISERIAPDGLYTAPLRERGIIYAEPDDIDMLQLVRVREVMTRNPQTVDADMSLDELRELFARSRPHGFCVTTEVGGQRRLHGVVTLTDLAAHPVDARTVRDICTSPAMTVTPEDPVFRAVRRMASRDVGRLPVVSAHDHGELVGLIRRADLVRAYQRAVTRQVGAQQRTAAAQLRELSGTRFLEVSVDARSPVTGRAVSDIAWPPQTVLTSIRRGGEVIMPDGASVLEADDEVVALTSTGSVDDVRALLTGRPPTR